MSADSILSVAIIDPVGKKAGIDHYDLLLLNGMKEAGMQTLLFSNFEYNGKDIPYHHFFHNTGVSKIRAVSSNFTGFIKSLITARKKKVEWLVLHVFRAGLFDLFTFSIAKLLGFKIAAIIHDVESLDTLALPLVRKIVVKNLPDVRVVHNEFCKEELIKSNGIKVKENTGIIPHVNFTDLFTDYHLHPELLQKLRADKKTIDRMHPELVEVVEKNIPVILFFGQIKKVKGIDVLLEAAAKCTTSFALVIAGKPRNENWGKYEQLIHQLNGKNKIIPIIRHISDEERDILFSIANGIVLPYRLIYQSGVLLMAMSFPAAVIASDLPPNKALIQNQQNGLLFQSENTNDLSEKIDFLILHQEAAAAMKQQALKDMKNIYSAKEIGMLYKNLLSQY